MVQEHPLSNISGQAYIAGQNKIVANGITAVCDFRSDVVYFVAASDKFPANII